MSGQIPKPIGPIIFVATLLMCGELVGLPTNTARADDCLAQPNSSAPAGSHWYYHLEKQHKCWYLRAPDQPAQHAAARAASEAAPATHTIPTGKPATTSQGAPDSINPTNSPPAWPRMPDQAAQHAAAPVAIAEAAPAARTIPNHPAIVSQGAPISITPGESPPPWPPHITMLAVKPLRAQNATTDEPVRESSLRGSVDSSILPAPAPQTLSLSQISTQTIQPAPAANTEQLDSSVTTVETQEAAAVPSDVRTESVQPSRDAILPDDAGRTGEGDASTTNTLGTMTFLTLTTPPEIFPILALALLMAGLLFRVVMRVAAVHRQRRIIIHRESDQIDEREELIDDELPPSANDQWSDNSRRPDDAADIKDQIKKRQDMLQELKRNLDQMLRLPRVA